MIKHYRNIYINLSIYAILKSNYLFMDNDQNSSLKKLDPKEINYSSTKSNSYLSAKQEIQPITITKIRLKTRK